MHFSLNLSENALVITLKLQRDTFSFADPTGQTLAARLDGTETPFKGGLSNTIASVKRVGESTIEVTNKRDGKVIEAWRFTPDADEKRMTVSVENKVKGTTWQAVLHKQ